MIRRVSVRYFKQFESQDFDLAEHMVLAGPNNSGKTSLLQAIVAWNLARERWRRRSAGGKQNVGVPVTRKDFTAVPLREMNHLWTNTSTAVRKNEPDVGKPGFPRFMQIELQGTDTAEQPWSLRFDFRCQSTEQIYIRPQDEHMHDIPHGAAELQIVHIPAFSGIGVAETRYDRPYQELLIGQGRAGDILRNLLLDLHKNTAEWDALVRHVQTIFGFTLLAPEYEGRPFILCDYVPAVLGKRTHSGLPSFDVASAGSGFHQVLLLLAFFYARPATVLLMDEPDAHQHVVLQKQVHDILRRIASERRSQLVVATHSEILIDSTSPDRILSFYGTPHILLTEVDRAQVREAIRRLPAIDILLAEESPGVLYVEGETDFNLLRAWARVTQHQTAAWFEKPFWHSNQGRHPREARAHFFALRAVRQDYKGLLILDGDDRNMPEREIATAGLTIERWRRYEAESYLHPSAVIRWVENKWGPLFTQQASMYLQDQLPPAALRAPLDDAPFWIATPVSKTLLPALFEACKLAVRKPDYHLIAEQMRPEEVHPEVIAKLDALAAALGLSATTNREDASE